MASERHLPGGKRHEEQPVGGKIVLDVAQEKGLVADSFPSPDSPQQEGCISYHLRTGKHFLAPYDWHRYMDFADKHGWRSANVR
jgi:hypothetical protein